MTIHNKKIDEEHKEKIVIKADIKKNYMKSHTLKHDRLSDVQWN
jgi:hypothetical protein